MTSYNINDKVRLRLRKGGADTMNGHNKEWGLPARFKVGDEVDMQLWEVMNIFGPEMFNGNSPPFDTEIVLLGPVVTRG